MVRLWSGLYVPASALQPPDRDGGEFVSDGTGPNSMQQMMLRPSSGDLGLDPMSLPELRREAAAVGFEPGFIGLCGISARLWEIWQDGSAQLDFARHLFNDGPIVERLARFLERYPGSVLFSQQQIYVAQRLLVQHAREEAYDYALTVDEIVSLSRLLIHSADVVDASTPRLTSGEAELIDVVAWTVQAGAFSARPAQLNEFGRSYDIFFRRARASVDERVPLDQWAQEDVQLTLEEQLSGGWGMNAMALKADQPDAPLPAMLLPPILENTEIADAEPRVLDALSAPRAWFQERFAEGDQTVRDVAWEVVPFMRRPFLRLQSDRLALSSPGAMTNWLGFGIYDRLRLSARDRKTKKSDTLSLFGAAYGDLVEDYVLDLVKSVYPNGGVYGDEPYGKGGGKRTPDVAIFTGSDLVLIEVRSGFLSPWLLSSGDVREFTDQLDRLVFRKIEQLGRRVADLRLKTARIGEIDIDKVHRIWPVLITADLTITEHLWKLIDAVVPAALKLENVQKLVLGDIEDLELLMGLVEEGHDLVEMLDARQTSGYGELELKRWVLEELKASNLTRPKSVLENWQRATDSMNQTLWPGAAEGPGA